jgi:hypothetical protein
MAAGPVRGEPGGSVPQLHSIPHPSDSKEKSMLSPVPRRPLAALAVAILALAATACGSSHSTIAVHTTATTVSGTPTTALVAVAGRNTSVVLNPETLTLLREHEITVSAVAPASYQKTLVWPISGGQISAATISGTIDQTGGVKLSHSGKSVALTSFITSTSAKQVTAIVGGQRIPVFDINTSSETRRSETGGAIVVGGLGFTVTEQAANAVNSALGVSAFKQGQVFGVVTETLVVK